MLPGCGIESVRSDDRRRGMGEVRAAGSTGTCSRRSRRSLVPLQTPRLNLATYFAYLYFHERRREMAWPKKRGNRPKDEDELPSDLEMPEDRFAKQKEVMSLNPSDDDDNGDSFSEEEALGLSGDSGSDLEYGSDDGKLAKGEFMGVAAAHMLMHQYCRALQPLKALGITCNDLAMCMEEGF